MSEGLGSNEAHSAGSGSQSVNIVVSSGSVKWLVIAVLAFMALLIVTNRTASNAELKANLATKSAENAETEFRVMQLWAQRVSVACEAKGVNLPPSPFLKASN